MKNIVITIVILVSALTAQAQKLVIGDKMPDLKGIQWLSSAPQSGASVYVDFYQSTNATCNQNLAKLKTLKEQNPRLTIVLLTRENNDAITALVKEYGSQYSIGYDSDGKKYESFGVKFVPFSMAFSPKGTLLWQGNISQLTNENLKGI